MRYLQQRVALMAAGLRYHKWVFKVVAAWLLVQILILVLIQLGIRMMI
ncbi:hypothetical protein [Dongshaea marina]|nr:hypothetical protein [Dongshaea marina]